MTTELQKCFSELKIYSGNVLEYRRFIHQLKAVLVFTEDDEQRMGFLDLMTTGEANTLVRSYSSLDAKSGFPAAMKRLENVYGNKDVIADAYIKKVFEWPAITKDDPKALREFSCFLTECMNAVETTNSSPFLASSENVRLMKKLPHYHGLEWRCISSQHREIHGTHIPFSEFVKYVQKVADASNDPFFGKPALEPFYAKNHSRSQRQKQFTK